MINNNYIKEKTINQIQNKHNNLKNNLKYGILGILFKDI